MKKNFPFRGRVSSAKYDLTHSNSYEFSTKSWALGSKITRHLSVFDKRIVAARVRVAIEFAEQV